ncbi:MAG: ABC transporter substrate-binding protein [Gemmataceae bacterium]|nr:ABC transporter substrate-binding protein [Gemmataceae bacterium]
MRRNSYWLLVALLLAGSVHFAVAQESKPDRPKDSSPTAGEGEIDFAAEAAKATHPDVKKLYQTAALRADRVLLRRTNETILVDLIADYVGNRQNQRPVPYRPLTPQGKPGVAEYTAAIGEILSAVSYEEQVLAAVNAFLVDMTRLPAGNPRYLPPVDVLTAAETVLTATMAFHEWLRRSERRRGDGWDAIRGHLRARLLEVQADLLRALTVSSDSAMNERAAELARKMADLYPDSPLAHREVLLWKLAQVGSDLSVWDQPFIDAAGELRQLQTKFNSADPKIFEPLRDALRRRAAAHVDEAKRLAVTDDGKVAAQRQVEMAIKIWPDLPGLREYQIALAREFRVLVVAVRHLPELISPALAETDVDRWACELVFESLVRAVPDPEMGYRYRPGLALRMPRLISMGREFELPRDAMWIDRSGRTERLDASDVRGTLAMLQDRQFSKLPVATFTDLLTEPSIQDAFRFPLRLDRGTVDPLRPMTFKVLPARLLASRPDRLIDREFALNPVGSGPFMYLGRKTEDGREYAIFRANPAFSQRTGRFGRPRIQEIRFTVRPEDPAKDLREGKIDLLLDVPTAEMLRLREPSLELSTVVTDRTLWSRRIWMLAVNHRRPHLGIEGRPLRRAIAFAINREEILRTLFKAGTLHHRPLNGPFPPDTWAVPETSRRLYDTERANFEAKNVKSSRFTLVFADDPLSLQACTRIKEQVQLVGITLELKPLPPREFHRTVMLEHDYDLAYMPYDYPTEWYPLHYLFDLDAMDRGERNFLGYQPDAKIGQLLTRINSTRDFGKIREAMHLLYQTFDDQMPFIPLWHLDFHLILSQRLETVPTSSVLDPLTIFEAAEEWRVNR